MTPHEVVEQFWNLVEARAEASDDDLYQRMSEAGVAHAAADRCYKLSQVAWGRVFLQGLGIEFSDKYLCLDANGDLVEYGQLSGEQYFVAATRLAERLGVSPAMTQVALGSAEVHAVNDALNAGSDPADLVTGPTCMFVEPPTDEGLRRARQTIENHLKQ